MTAINGSPSKLLPADHRGLMLGPTDSESTGCGFEHQHRNDFLTFSNEKYNYYFFMMVKDKTVILGTLQHALLGH